MIEISTIGAGAFKPVIQSAVGIVRESAGLVINLAALGAALISDSKPNPASLRSSPRLQAVARRDNIIPFPISQKRGRN